MFLFVVFFEVAAYPKLPLTQQQIKVSRLLLSCHMYPCLSIPIWKFQPQ